MNSNSPCTETLSTNKIREHLADIRHSQTMRTKTRRLSNSPFFHDMNSLNVWLTIPSGILTFFGGQFCTSLFWWYDHIQYSSIGILHYLQNCCLLVFAIPGDLLLWQPRKPKNVQNSNKKKSLVIFPIILHDFFFSSFLSHGRSSGFTVAVTDMLCSLLQASLASLSFFPLKMWFQGQVTPYLFIHYVTVSGSLWQIIPQYIVS